MLIARVKSRATANPGLSPTRHRVGRGRRRGERRALQEAASGLPVDRRDHLEGQQRVGEEGAQERGVGELAPPAGEGGDDDQRAVPRRPRSTVVIGRRAGSP